MSNVPEGAQLSEDGQWWWDDAAQTWKSVSGDAAGGQSGGGGGEGGAPGGDLTAEEAQAVDDLKAEPGKEELLDERKKPYFQPTAGEDPALDSEIQAALDDSQFQGSSSNQEGS